MLTMLMGFSNIKKIAGVIILLGTILLGWYLIDNWAYKPLREYKATAISTLAERDEALTQAGELISKTYDELQTCKENAKLDKVDNYFDFLEEVEVIKEEGNEETNTSTFNLYNFRI